MKRGKFARALTAVDKLPSELDNAGLPPSFQPLSNQNRLHLGKANVDVIIDQHIVIGIPMDDLIARAVHAAGDNFIAVGPTATQAGFQRGNAGR